MVKILFLVVVLQALKILLQEEYFSLYLTAFKNLGGSSDFSISRLIALSIIGRAFCLYSVVRSWLPS